MAGINKTTYKLGHISSKTDKLKISKSLIKYYKNHIHPMKNKHLTKCHKQDIRNALTGRKLSIDVKLKMSKTHKKIGSGKWMLGRISVNKGRKVTEITKEKIRTSLHNHHIDLNVLNNAKFNKLKLIPSIHQKLHKQAYRYLVEHKMIRLYMKWFEKKNNLILRSDK